MKIFTLLQNLLKMFTGQSSRNVTFNEVSEISSAENMIVPVRVNLASSQYAIPSVQNKNVSVYRVETPNGHSIVHVQHTATPARTRKSIYQNQMAPAKNESISFEYKLSPVQKKITSVQNIKPVFMQNFFAIVKKIFSLSDHPTTLLENLNDGYHPGCHYGTAGTENISGNNSHHDVAHPAASFALIPLALTPTAMNHSEKKPVKTITGRSGLVGILMLMSSMFFVSTAMAQRTASVSGNWSSTATWGGAAVPIATDAVTINSGISVTVDIPTANCASLSFLQTATNNSTVTIGAGNTLNVTGAVTIPRQGTNNNTMAVGAGTLNAGSIAFTNGGGTQRHFLTISTGTATISGDITQTGSSGSATITFTGAGLLQLGGAFLTPATGTFTASTGTVEYNGTTQSIGAFTYNNLKLSNSGTKSLVATTPVNGNLSVNGAQLNLADLAMTVGSLTGSGNITNTTGGTTARTLTVGSDGSSPAAYSGVISNGTNTGGVALTKTGAGTLLLTGNNIYTGATTITAGTLTLNPASSPLTLSTPFVLNGGTLSTAGVALNTTITNSSTLALNASSTINLGSTLHSISFLNSSAIAWPGATLTIINWTGTPGQSGTNGQIFFGATTGTLTAAQLGKISFTGFPGTPILLSTGELVPNGSPLLGITGTTNNGNSCIGTAAAPKTYTITNTGAQADGITVVSSDPQFVVSGLSSTSIPAGGTATYQVTFTPASAGPQTAIITVASTTTGSNSPTSNLTGTGGATGSWLGITDNSWFTATNWCGGVPTATSNITILSGTTFQPTIGAAGAVCNNITINSGATLTITGTNSLGVSGNWTNNGTFTGATSTIDFNSNISQILIAGTSTFGNVTHSGTASLQLSTNNLLTNATGTFNNSGAGVFDLNGLNATVGGLTGAGTITNSLAASAVTFAVNGSISPAAWTGEIQDGNGTIALTKSGTGALTLASTNTYSGATTLTAGTLNINNGSALGNSIFTITGGTIDNTLGSLVTLNNNVQNWNASFTFIGSNDLNLGTGTVSMNVSRTITVNAGTLTVGGIISGAGSRLTKSGNGALTLTAANAFTNGTTLTAGTLNINNLQALGTAAGTFIINGGTIDNTSGAAITTLDYPETWGGSFAFTGTNNLNLGTHLGTGTVAMAAARTVTVNGGNLTVGSVISGAGRLTKAGAGTMTLTETNTFTGGTTVSAGTLNINNSQALGTVAGTFIISGGSIDNTSGAVLTTLNYPQTWSGDFTFKGTNDLNFGTGAIALSTATRQVTVTAGTLTEGGAISGAGFGITKLGAGILTLNGSSTYTGVTTITAGELRFSPAASTTFNSQIALNGGILGTTGIGSGLSVTDGSTLNLTANSSINLDPAIAHSLKFANSSAVTWTSGTLLTVFGWQGTAGSSGTAGKIFFGNSLNTLTTQQLSQIKFDQFNGIPIILVGTGEIVPQGATASLNVAGTLNNGSACIGVAAPTQTYTITNTGPVDATGITVTSDNAQFVVSNISGTTAQANSVNNVTFQVTFTPTSAGAQSANITVFSAGSNSPVPVVTGTGLALPVSTFTYNPGDPSTTPGFCQAAITNPSPTTPFPSPSFIGGGVAGTFSASPAGLVFISTSTGQVDLKNTAPGTYTVTNSVTGGNGCTTSATAQIKINALPAATITYAQPAFCTTDLNVEPVTLVPSTGLTGSYSSIPAGLTLNTATGAITPSTSTPGNYKVIFNYFGGPNLCPNTDTAFVTIAQTATGTISYQGSPYCTNFGTATVTTNLTGTTTGAQYSALPAGLIIDANTGAVTTLGSTAGSYSVTVTIPSLGGCDPFTTSAPISITDTPSASITYGGTLCTNAGTANPIITGPTGGTFVSTPAGLNISASTGIITLGTSTAGTYTVTYTTPAVNGCTSKVKTTVTIQASTATPVLNTATICTNTTPINITLSGEANGTPISVLANGSTILSLTRNGTTANYTIPANTFHNGDVITITAQATGKCLSLPSNSVVVGTPPNPGGITGSNSVCPNTTGNAYSVPTVAGVTYAWAYTPATGVTITNANTATPTIAFGSTATSGTLTVTASNTCGAGGSQSLGITVNAGAPTTSPGSITGLATVCSGSTQTYSIGDVAGATTYTWTVPTGWTINFGQGGSSINVTAGTPGQNGNITVVASNSCGNAPNPASNAVTTAVLNAKTGADNTGASGGSVAWTNPGNITTVNTPYATAQTIATLAPTTHYLIGSNYGFSIPANASIQGITVTINRMASAAGITENTVSLVKATNVLVGNNQASATAWPTAFAVATYGSTTNNWGTNLTPADVNNTGFGVALSVTNSVFGLTTSTVDYIQISVTYATPQSLPVTVSSGPTITLGASPVLLCNGSISASLPYTGTTGNPDQYSITYDGTAIGAGFSNVAITLLPVSPITLALPPSLAAGTYNGTITVSSSTGCTGLTSVPFTITVPSAITTGTSESDANCFGGSDGSATVTPLGGTGTYTIGWTGPNNFTGSGATISGLVAGTYNYSITDGNGCGPLTGSVIVGQAAQITATTSKADASCFGNADGSATVTPANGIGGYTITWTGPGGPAGSGPTISGLVAGTYNYSITDGNGCGPITGSVVVGQPTQISATTTIVNACSDGTGGSVTINPTGGAGAPYFILSNGDGPTTIDPGTLTSLPAGDYDYLVFDNTNTCNTEIFFTVGTAAQITVTGVSQTTIDCNGGLATVTITATGGSAALTYIFDGVSNSTGVFTHAAGTGISYTVTDLNDCAPATGTFTVVQPAAITVSDISQTTIACNGGSATVTITATGGTGTLSYTFDGVTNTTGIFTHAAGTNLPYSVTDANNCTPAAGTFSVVQPAIITVSNVGQSTILCNGGTATVTITAAGGTLPLSYTFDGVTNNTGTFTHAAGTGFSYSVTDANNCTAVNGTFDIVQPAAVTVSDIQQSVIDCNGGTATVTITATGGTGTLSYTFDGLTNTTGIFTHAAGTALAYSVTDANNCTPAAGTFSVLQPDAITISSISQNTIACSGGTPTVTIVATGGTGTLSYTFDGVTNTTGIFPHAAGTGLPYSVTDANNCTPATGTFTVVQPAAVTVSNVQQSTILCNGGTATVTITATGGTGALSYTFDGVTNTTGIFTHAAGTGLLYSVTDGNGCTPATGTFNVVQPAIITVSNVGQSTILCNGGNATVTITAAGGTAPLSYTFDGVTNSSGTFTHAAGTGLPYSVTDANNCTAVNGTFDVIQPSIITVSNVTQSTIACNGGSATVTITAAGGTGILSYTFDGLTNTTGVFTHTAGTAIAYSVTDANNCNAATGTFNVVEPAAITVSGVTQTPITCNGGTSTVTITGTGGTGTLSYTFDGVTNTTGIFTHGAGVGLLYSVTDANNCTPATGTITIVQPAAIIVSNIAQTTIDCNGGTATVTFTASGGTGTLSYTFDGVTNTTGIFTHAAGNSLPYSITDANNCTPITGTFNIVQPAAILVSGVAQSTINCNGGSATVTITATGGTAPLSYTFDGVTNSTGIFTHAAGNGLPYSVTDAKNCTPVTGTFNVLQPAVIAVTNVSQGTIICSGGTTTVTITATGGTGALSYTFDGVTNSTGIFTHAAGTGLLYSVTDANLCNAATGTVDITQSAVLAASLTASTNITCFGANNGTATITVTGGTPAYLYSIDGNTAVGGTTNSSKTFTGLAPGGHTVVITDNNGSNGCSTSVTFTLTQPTQLAAIASAGTISCNNSTTSLFVIANGGTAPYMYSLNGGTPQSGFVFTVGAGPSYVVTVTDANNCTVNTAPISVANPTQMTIAFSGVTPAGCTGSTGSFTVTASGGAGSYSYSLNGGTFQPGGTFSLLAPNTYLVTAKDANGCTISGNITIGQAAPPTVFNVTGGGSTCTGQAFAVGLSNAQLGITYYLLLNNVVIQSQTSLPGSAFSFGNMTAPGIYTVIALDAASGCQINMSGSATIASGGLPAAYNVTGGGSYCSGGQGLHVGLQNSESGVTYQVFNGATVASGLFPGSTGSQIDFGVFQAGTYRVVATNAAGCTNNMAGNVTIALTPTPAAETLIAPSGVNDCTGTGVDIQLAGSESGVSYQLYFNGIATGSLISGTGNPIDLGKKPSGTYTIVGTSNTGGCIGNTSNSITVNSGTAPAAFSVTGGGNYCSGPGIAIGLLNSETGVSYVLVLNGSTNVGFATGTSGNSLTFGTYTAIGTYTVTATNTITNCTAPMANNVSILAGTLPTAYNVTGTGSYCTGGPGVKVGLSNSDNGINYQLLLSGSPVGAALVGNGGPLDFGFQTAGTYTVQATNSTTGCTNNMTGSAIISISGSSVVINTQPVGGAFCGSIQLSVSASNATGFQWFLGVSSIAGATNPTYTATAAGSYTVVVSGTCGAPVTSNAAVLTTIPAAIINTQPVGGSFCGSQQLSVSASNASGYQWFLGVSSIAGATNPTYTATVGGSYTVVVSGACGAPVTSNAAVLTAPAPVNITTQPQSQTFTGSNLLSVVASNATGYQWKLGGSDISGANSPTYTATAAGSYTVLVTGLCGSQQLSNAAVLSTCASVVINTQPLTQTFCGNVTLSVSASNASGYQWKLGVNNIIGANNPTYLANAAGSYTVVVSGTCGSPVTSNAAILTAAPVVAINTQPLSQSFCGSVTLSVGASNANGYQWKLGGNNIPGANNPTYLATAAGSYTVVVSGPCGSPVTSNAAILTANGSVAITTQPTNKSICSGGSATFSVTASNASGYQWFRNNNSIPGATNPTYTTSTVGNYKVVVSGGCGSPVTSNTVSLSVSAGVTIVTQPVSTQICAGGTESFSVVATNATGYQWYRNSNLIIGATSAQYFTGTPGRYDCRVFNACGGSVMSDFAFLTINGPVAITSQPQSKTICSEGTATFTVGANNANGFQWYRNNNAIPGAVNTSYTTGTPGNYKVVVRGGCGGPITSNVATLSFLPPPPVAGINGTGTICAGTTVRFTDATSGGTWSSSDISVATVSATGFVRGVSAGTATIRYTISNGCSTNTATRNITVNGVPAVQDITGSSSVCPGSTILLSDGTPNGDWSSSNTSIATVNNNGRVRGIRNGNVTISYTVQNSCGMKTVSTPIAVNCSSSIQKNSLGATGNSTDELALNVTVGPNPSQNFFTLIAQSSVLDAPINISIFDMQNRLVDKHKAGVGEAVRFGDRLAAGMYIIQVTQGSLQKTVKVVKN